MILRAARSYKQRGLRQRVVWAPAQQRHVQLEYGPTNGWFQYLRIHFWVKLSLSRDHNQTLVDFTTKPSTLGLNILRNPKR